jgi:hypothetical protein
LEKDDEYNGYHIPAQSIVIGNAWYTLHHSFSTSSLTYQYRAMMNDEADYPSPETFDPERYLKDGYPDLSVRDPTSLAFGFGRR